MGFGNIATTIILFIAVLTLATGVIITLNNNVARQQAGMKIQSDYLNNQLKTNILITSTNYTAGTTTLYVSNEGSTTLKPDKTDLYLDGQFIPRNTTNRTITIESSTDITNPGLWDPDEIVKITITKTLNSGEHRVIVMTQYGVKDEQLFST